MSVSPQLLALMSVTPTRNGGVTSWSILMDFRYPFSWETTAAFVLRAKAKGPPDDMVSLKIDRNVFEYDVCMPWYARLILGKNIIWRDTLRADPTKKILSEDGINISLRHRGTVRDCSSWCACQDDAGVTLYSKRVDFEIRMPVGPTIMAQVAQPLIRWFRTKSQLCRELEVQAIRDFLDSEKEDTPAARAKRIANDAAWMAALTMEAPEVTQSSPTSSSPSSPCCSEASRKEGLGQVDRAEEEEEEAEASSPCSSTSTSKPSTTRLAGVWTKVKHWTIAVKVKVAKAMGARAAAERSRPHSAAATARAADGSSV